MTGEGTQHNESERVAGRASAAAESYDFARVCAECQYEMTGLAPEMPCPECGGQHRVPRPAHKADQLATWLILLTVGLVPFCGPVLLVAAPLTLLVAIRMTVILVTDPIHPRYPWLIVAAYAFWAFMTAVVVVAVKVGGVMPF